MVDRFDHDDHSSLSIDRSGISNGLECSVVARDSWILFFILNRWNSSLHKTMLYTLFRDSMGAFPTGKIWSTNQPSCHSVDDDWHFLLFLANKFGGNVAKYELVMPCLWSYTSVKHSLLVSPQSESLHGPHSRNWLDLQKGMDFTDKYQNCGLDS